jgi:hypothetical protein
VTPITWRRSFTIERVVLSPCYPRGFVILSSIRLTL